MAKVSTVFQNVLALAGSGTGERLNIDCRVCMRVTIPGTVPAITAQLTATARQSDGGRSYCLQLSEPMEIRTSLAQQNVWITTNILDTTGTLR